MAKILLVEDNPEMNEMLKMILSPNHQVVCAFSGTEALLHFKNDSFDLIILDRMLPGKSGEEVLGEIRKHSSVPILILTAINDQKDIARLLLAGANDYLTKPFDIDVLKARIAVQLRNQPFPKQKEYLAFKQLSLNLATFVAEVNGQVLNLKRKEFEILALLLTHPQKVYTKEDLYEKIWGEAYYGDENTINVHISNIRKKLKDLDPDNHYIETVWGIGIKLADGGEKS